MMKAKTKCAVHKHARISYSLYPIMPALFLILGSAYYAQNYAGIIDAGLIVVHVL